MTHASTELLSEVVRVSETTKWVAVVLLVRIFGDGDWRCASEDERASWKCRVLMQSIRNIVKHIAFAHSMTLTSKKLL
jgi:hypothetical protein